jgi:hypothetical protein
MAAPAGAQKPIAYPAKGQSQSQQAKDDGECVTWANQQTAGAQQAAAQPQRQGERARGAAKGAIVAEVADGDAGKGAAVGAVAGGSRQRQANRAAQANAQGSFAQAYGACMSGRGYTVK